MRKTLLILVGTVTGLAASFITTQPQLLSDGLHAQAAANVSYHQLSLFKEVLERVRDNYAEKPDDARRPQQWASSQPMETMGGHFELELLVDVKRCSDSTLSERWSLQALLVDLSLLILDAAGRHRFHLPDGRRWYRYA